MDLGNVLSVTAIVKTVLVGATAITDEGSGSVQENN